LLVILCNLRTKACLRPETIYRSKRNNAGLDDILATAAGKPADRTKKCNRGARRLCQSSETAEFATLRNRIAESKSAFAKERR
jgi:hypothetical protein